MTALVIVLLILLGLFLLILEFFVFPGISFAGVGGVVFVGVGVFLGYQEFGTLGGHITLVSTLLASVLVVVYSLRSGTWKKLMLDTTLEGKVETVPDMSINVGDNAEAITRLNPVGKAMVNGEIVEARCPGHFIDEHTKLIVTKVFKTYIIVKPLKENI